MLTHDYQVEKQMNLSKSWIKSCSIIVVITLVMFSFIMIFNSTTEVKSTELSEDSPWPCFRQNSQRTGSVDEGTTNIQLDERWNTSLENDVIGSPVITENGDILQTTGDTLFSINQNGQKNWEYTFDEFIQSTPAISEDGTIYVGSVDRNLTALNQDGTEKWRFPTKSRIDSSPVIGPDGNIYFGNNDGVIYSLNPEGEKEWNRSFKGENEGRMIQSSPAIDEDGHIYIASTRLNEQGSLTAGKLHALYPNGTERWTFERDIGIASSPAVGDDGRIYIGVGDGHLFAIDKDDGSEVWRFGVAGPVFSSPSIGADGTVYIGAYDHNLYAVNSDGTEKWNFSTGNFIFSSPSIGQDGTIYFGSFDENIYALNPNGTQKWNSTLDSEVLSSPAIGGDGSVYITTFDGTLYAFRPMDRPFEITNTHVLLMIVLVVGVGLASSYYFKGKKEYSES